MSIKDTIYIILFTIMFMLLAVHDHGEFQLMNNRLIEQDVELNNKLDKCCVDYKPTKEEIQFF